LKTLTQILPTNVSYQLIGNKQRNVSGIHIDSRNVKEGDVFIALKGYTLDGHDFIPKAIELGAKVIVSEVEMELDGVTLILVSDSRMFAGQMLNRFYDDPTSSLKLVGITGTNGKTTTCTILYDVFKGLGYKVGLLSTVENKIMDDIIPSRLTTPDVVGLYELLAQMVKQECEFVFMEVSSHAIHQKRIEGLRFCGGLFTNISRDHLNYHNSFKEYIDVKKKFFDNLDNDVFAVTNADDKHGDYMLQNCKAVKRKYSLHHLVDYKTKIFEHSLEGLYISINQKDLHTMFTGRFNAYNITGAFAVAMELGQNEEEVLLQLSVIRPAEGRFDIIRGTKKKVYAVVDYAHTPDALENVLTSVNDLIRKDQIITVVGCGGNRDKGKRPQMAKIACHLSGQVILTSDNPRDEDPADILKDMSKGLTEEMEEKTIVIENRKQAINTAVKLAR